jgi:hypothetical protein
LQANVVRPALTVRQHAAGIPFAPQVSPPLPHGTGATLALLELVVEEVIVVVERLDVVVVVLAAVVVLVVVLVVAADPGLVVAFNTPVDELSDAPVEPEVVPVVPEEVSLRLPAGFGVYVGDATWLSMESLQAATNVAADVTTRTIPANFIRALRQALKSLPLSAATCSEGGKARDRSRRILSSLR